MPVAGSNTGTGAPALIGVAGSSTVITALPVAPTVANTPLTVSLDNALPMLALPAVPLTPVMTSSVTTKSAAGTVTTAFVVAQFVGLSFSQMV